MTDNEMAAALIAKGWTVKPPLTQANCPHHNTRGSCSVGTGGYRSEWWCLDCGKHSVSEVLPTLEQATFANLQPPHNSH